MAAIDHVFKLPPDVILSTYKQSCVACGLHPGSNRILAGCKDAWTTNLQQSSSSRSWKAFLCVMECLKEKGKKEMSLSSLTGPFVGLRLGLGLV